MPEELVQNTASTVVLVPDFVPVSATVALYDDQGAQIGAVVAAVIDGASAAITALGSTPEVATVDDGSDLDVWAPYLYTSGSGWSGKVRVTELAGDEVTLASPPPGTPAEGDTLKGLRCTATFPATALTRRGSLWRLDWTVVDGAGAPHRYRQQAHVVAMPFRAPITAGEVRQLAGEWPSWANAQGAGLWHQIAERSCAMVRADLTSAGDYPHLVGDQEALKLAGEVAARLELARRGRVPPGYDAPAYVEATEKWLRTEIRRAIAGLSVDRNDDGATSPTERLTWGSIAIERV